MLAFVLFLVSFSLYFSVNTISGGDDHFFHFRFAQQITQDGFFNSFQNFHSIYLSKMAVGSEYFIYYNFLFYFFLLPFSLLSPLYLGIKLYAVFAVTAVFLILYWCLEKVQVRGAFFWIAVLLSISSVESIWRLFLSRPYTLAPAILLVLLVFLYKKNYAGVFIVSFIYLFWHGATFFMPFGIALIYFLAEKFYGLRADSKNLLMALGGTVLAVLATFLVSSGFFLYMRVNFGSFIDKLYGISVNIAEGGELYPINFFDLVKSNPLIFTLFVAAMSINIFEYFAYKTRKITSDKYWGQFAVERRVLQISLLLVIAMFFLGTVAISGRFGDFFTVFIGLYVGLSFDYIFRSINFVMDSGLKKAVLSGLLISLVYVFVTNMLFLRVKLAYGTQANEFYTVGNWLSVNTTKGDKVFLTNWSYFTQLYYYSPLNDYSSGIEPRFLYDFDHKLYWLYVHMSDDGYVCIEEKCPKMRGVQISMLKTKEGAISWAKSEGDEMASILSKDFKSKYVVTSPNSIAFNYILDHNIHFERKIYDSVYGYAVYEIYADEGKTAK